MFNQIKHKTMKIEMVVIEEKNGKKFFRCYDNEENMVVLFLIKAMLLTKTVVLDATDNETLVKIGNKLIGMEIEKGEE